MYIYRQERRVVYGEENEPGKNINKYKKKYRQERGVVCRGREKEPETAQGRERGAQEKGTSKASTFVLVKQVLLYQ
jgi:hypothetical protein